jgi:hypothetical protein
MYIDKLRELGLLTFCVNADTENCKIKFVMLFVAGVDDIALETKKGVVELSRVGIARFPGSRPSLTMLP